MTAGFLCASGVVCVAVALLLFVMPRGVIVLKVDGEEERDE